MVSTLSQSLDLDAGTLIPELREAEELHQRNTGAAAESEQQAAGGEEEEMIEEEEEEPKHTKNGIAADNDFSDLLPVSSDSNIVLYCWENTECPLPI